MLYSISYLGFCFFLGGSRKVGWSFQLAWLTAQNGPWDKQKNPRLIWLVNWPWPVLHLMTSCQLHYATLLREKLNPSSLLSMRTKNLPLRQHIRCNSIYWVNVVNRAKSSCDVITHYNLTKSYSIKAHAMWPPIITWLSHMYTVTSVFKIM